MRSPTWLRLTLALAIIGASAVQAQTYKVSRTNDEFTKTSYADLTVHTTEPLRKADLTCTNTKSRAVFASIVIRRMVKERDTTVALYAYYGGAEWLFLGQERSLLMLANDSTRAFTGLDAASRDVARGGVVSETQIYVLNDDDVRWLMSVQPPRVRLDGEKGQCDFAIPAGSWNLLRLFVKREIQGDSSAAP